MKNVPRWQLNKSYTDGDRDWQIEVIMQFTSCVRSVLLRNERMLVVFYTPVVNSHVHSRLLKFTSDVNQRPFQFIHANDFCLVWHDVARFADSSFTVADPAAWNLLPHNIRIHSHFNKVLTVLIVLWKSDANQVTDISQKETVFVTPHRLATRRAELIGTLSPSPYRPYCSSPVQQYHTVTLPIQIQSHSAFCRHLKTYLFINWL